MRYPAAEATIGYFPVASMTDDSPAPSTCNDPPVAELTTAEALSRVLDAVIAVNSSEELALSEAMGRVTSEAILSPLDVPGHTNSAMDGYALRGEDLATDGMAVLGLVGQALAGHPFEGALGGGQCISITTGAAIPQGADTVVMQEYVRAEGDRIRLLRPCKAGDNVRKAGEDIRRGGLVADAGTRVSPALLGVLASLGLDRVRVKRRPRVAVFSTGDEVQAPGTALRPGGVYDSNRFTLHGMLTETGLDVIDSGQVPDDPQALHEAFAAAASAGDAVITSGGVSVGEADFIKPILAELGKVEFWKLAIKPGRPLTFGHLGDTLFFGLPGNPVAVMVTYLQLVRPALHKLMGTSPAPLLALRARCTDHLLKKPGRREFQRGILTSDENGDLKVGLTGKQGSGILSSMNKANCLIVLTEEQAAIKPGEEVRVELLPWGRIADISR